MVALSTALLNGLILGLIYVAIAVGLTIVFGMLRLVNFAHGAFYAIGAYVGLWSSPSNSACCAGVDRRADRRRGFRRRSSTGCCCASSTTRTRPRRFS